VNPSEHRYFGERPHVCSGSLNKGRRASPLLAGNVVQIADRLVEGLKELEFERPNSVIIKTPESLSVTMLTQVVAARAGSSIWNVEPWPKVD
jgi:hypothetical protein